VSCPPQSSADKHKTAPKPHQNVTTFPPPEARWHAFGFVIAAQREREPAIVHPRPDFQFHQALRHALLAGFAENDRGGQITSILKVSDATMLSACSMR